MGRPLDIEPDILQERLTSWLRDREGDGDLEITGISIPDNGASNLTVLVAIASTDRPGLRVLRTQSNGPQLYSTYDLARQYRIMELLSGTTVKVPRLVGYESDLTVLGREFFVMYGTGGRPVIEWPSYHRSGWFHDLAPEQQTNLWNQTIDAISEIHGLEWQALGLSFVTMADADGDHVSAWLRGHVDRLEWMEDRAGRTAPQLRRAFEWLTQNMPQGSHTSLIWADAKLGNLMLDEHSIVGMLDWEHCTIGPSLYDLANLMIFDRMLSDSARITRLPGLPDRTASIARYEESSGREAQDIEYFELFSAARMASVQFGLAQELVDAGRVPPSYVDDNLGTRLLASQLASMDLEL